MGRGRGGGGWEEGGCEGYARERPLRHDLVELYLPAVRPAIRVLERNTSASPTTKRLTSGWIERWIASGVPFASAESTATSTRARATPTYWCDERRCRCRWATDSSCIG